MLLFFCVICFSLTNLKRSENGSISFHKISFLPTTPSHHWLLLFNTSSLATHKSEWWSPNMRLTHWGWRAGGIWDRRSLCGPPAAPAASPPAPDLSGPDLTESPQLGTGWTTVPPENTGCWLCFYSHYIHETLKFTLNLSPVFMVILYWKENYVYYSVSVEM